MSEAPCPIESSKKAIKAEGSRTIQKINMNGYFFEGPYELDDELPAEAGVCLVCTESGYGIKVMSIEDTTDISDCIAKNKRRDCWKRTAEKDFVDIYFALMPKKEDRAKAASTVRDRRKYKLACEE
ncbi:MAG: hypothetical protein LBH69_00270 [Methanomassiliicoccaceae archaeon]|nr:hypothetical protein [Methanomassiliicoccaceae archaeon]